MPRLRRTDAEKAAEKRLNDLCFIGITIKSSCELKHGTVQAAAEAMSMSKSHLYDLIRRPERMTIDELWKISAMLPTQSKEAFSKVLIR